LSCQTITPILNTATFFVVLSGQFSHLVELLIPKKILYRGALEMVHLEVAAWFAQDNLKVIHIHPLKRIIFALLWKGSCLFHFGNALGRMVFIAQGDNVTELRVKFLRKIEDTVPAGDD
jgi:hypothetical protein